MLQTVIESGNYQARSKFFWIETAVILRALASPCFPTILRMISIQRVVFVWSYLELNTLIYPVSD